MKTTLQIFTYIVIILTASPVFASGWLIYHDSPYKGKVVDAETNQPIEGAAVVAVWYLERYGGLGGPVARFLNAKYFKLIPNFFPNSFFPSIIS